MKVSSAKLNVGYGASQGFIPGGRLNLRFRPLSDPRCTIPLSFLQVATLVPQPVRSQQGQRQFDVLSEYRRQM
ncbi:hypothetical protein R75483_02204 [Paraburkholderia domus]|nr:hypothetical protein R75483_02204 [Paraburkholderia domus]